MSTNIIKRVIEGAELLALEVQHDKAELKRNVRALFNAQVFELMLHTSHYKFIRLLPLLEASHAKVMDTL